MKLFLLKLAIIIKLSFILRFSEDNKKNDASIILKGKAFQNPSSVSCLEGIPDFRVLPPLPLLPKFKAGSKISSFRRILCLAVLQFHTASNSSFLLWKLSSLDRLKNRVSI